MSSQMSISSRVLVSWYLVSRPAVRKLVLPFARWLNYDRSGMGGGGRREGNEGPDQTPPIISAASVAVELDILLKNADIEPPFIVVAHSWGRLHLS